MLGPSAAADILQLSSSLPLQSRGRARLLVGNEDVHIIARSDDEFDDFFHEQSSTGGQAGEITQAFCCCCMVFSLRSYCNCFMLDFCFCLGTLSSIPTALTRWTDECKVLDAESMHDCVAGKNVSVMMLTWSKCCCTVTITVVVKTTPNKAKTLSRLE